MHHQVSVRMVLTMHTHHVLIFDKNLVFIILIIFHVFFDSIYSRFKLFNCVYFLPMFILVFLSCLVYLIFLSCLFIFFPFLLF